MNDWTVFFDLPSGTTEVEASGESGMGLEGFYEVLFSCSQDWCLNIPVTDATAEFVAFVRPDMDKMREKTLLERVRAAHQLRQVMVETRECLKLANNSFGRALVALAERNGAFKLKAPGRDDVTEADGPLQVDVENLVAVASDAQVPLLKLFCLVAHSLESSFISRRNAMISESLHRSKGTSSSSEKRRRNELAVDALLGDQRTEALEYLRKVVAVSRRGAGPT